MINTIYPIQIGELFKFPLGLQTSGIRLDAHE